MKIGFTTDIAGKNGSCLAEFLFKQVYRLEVKKIKNMQRRIRLDSWSIENCSLSVDINIIFHTVWNTIKLDENAY